jgi:tRNA(fMet)-specific endonuclease VapC
MSGKYLLDTNIVIALFANDDTVRGNLASADEVFIPNIVIGELIYGAYKSGRSPENLARVDDFTASNIIPGCDAETARWYGEIKFRLQQKGHPIPENDIWIAALAAQYELVLVSRDAHFSEVENLQVEVW